MSYMPPFPPDGRPSAPDRDDHCWIVSHLISLIGYCETEGLAEAERALTEATERLAPLLNGHRLERLRAGRTEAEPQVRADQVASILPMPRGRAVTTDRPHVPA